MEPTRMKTNRNLMLLGLCLLASPFLVQAQTTPVTCTNATLSGTHSMMLTGRSVLSTVVFSKVTQSVGTATFDGAGNFTFNLTTNTNQSAGTTQTLSGTYSLPTNCVGTLNITTGDTASFTLIPYASGNSFTITGQDATYSFTGIGTEQPAACLTSTLSGAYTFSGTGFPLASGVIGGVNTIAGVLQFDGAGAVTGNWSVATNGAATPFTITGHYSVSSSCVASATVTDANGLSYTLNFTITTVDGANFQLLIASSVSTFSGNGHNTFTNPGLAVANASFVTGGTPPGSLFSIYGSNLSTGLDQPATFPLPTTGASAMVTVNGEAAPLLYVSKVQINAQMPLDIQPGVATVVVKNVTTSGTTVSNAAAVPVPATAVPGVLVYGNNHTVAQNYPSYSLNSPEAPAKVDDIVIVYLLGAGPVQGGNLLVTGQATPLSPTFPVTENYSATIAGLPATVEFVGLTPGYAGLYQANVRIPRVGPGDHRLLITIGGKVSNFTLISTN
jgi:uncharacterized protein (TIGR03437 family)